MKAEITSASPVERDLLGLRELLRTLGFRVVEPIPKQMDNHAAIKQLESEDSMSSVKHVDIRQDYLGNLKSLIIVVLTLKQLHKDQ